ncbi:hypothetical protein [Streptomyces sp. NPDC059783]|uniref:hypothetical protein n=1 Tax=Streptomyces sp. NPDC059783 TaxID=3346944 RepID=UPI0036697B2C
MLPDRLVWRDPRPIPPFNRQEPVTVIVRDPAFHEPGDGDDCAVFGYACRTHGRAYGRGVCGEGAHLIALECQEHGMENMWPQPQMLLFPEGFDPPLGETELARIRTEWDGG